MNIAISTTAIFILISLGLCSGLTMNWEKLNAQAASKLCCNTYHPTQQIFYCRAWSQSNKQQNFFTFGSNGEVNSFVPNAVGYGHVEMKPASVKLAPNSAFPFPGWTLGDIFVPHKNGVIIKIEDASTIINPWVQLPETQMVAETHFDATGTVYDGDLIVTLTNAAYRISPNGSYSLIVKDSRLKNYEGLVIVPNDVSKYGKLAGTLLLPQTQDTTNVASPSNSPSGGSGAGGTIAVISKDKNITFVNSPCHADSMYIVDTYDQFYALDWEKGNIYFSSWDNLKKNGFPGEILIQCEGSNNSPTGFYRLYWTGTAIANEAINVCSGCATKPSTWEHFCTTRGASANQLPGGFSFCYYTSFQPNQKLQSFTINQTIANNWNYLGGSNNFVYPATGRPPAVANTMSISFVQDSTNQFYLQIVNGAPLGGNGYLDLSIKYSYVGVQDSSMLLRIRNNPGDNYNWDGSKGRFIWTWKNGTTGVVIGPMVHVTAMNWFTFTFTVTNVTGVNTLHIVSNGTTKVYSLSNGLTWDMTRISCDCGNGVNDINLIEQCDPTASSTGICCTDDCRFKPQTVKCNDTNPNDLCQVPSYCTGSSSTCPPIQTASACNCTSPLYGYNCTQARCDLLTSCNTCNQYSQCAWCCDSNSCVQNSSCTTRYPRSCASCHANCTANGGSCECGKCACPAGYAGDNCEFRVDCDGTILDHGVEPRKFDDCGVCGGNNTSCMGCDGKPYGLKYDACGVCGGNGSSCFNPCDRGEDCKSCVAESENCGWLDGKCVSVYDYPNADTECGLPIEVIVGASIGAGVIAAIVIGVAAFLVLSALGGKKGYDAYMRNKAGMNNAQGNPMYNDNNRSGNNPFYA